MTVFWTHTAERQREHVFNYWNDRNGSANYSVKLRSAISIVQHLLYKLIEPKLIIVGFWDNRQDPAQLLAIL
ncbi:MAG: hypothetical protein IPO56_14645 [Flavobacteriales bacterium]|nr:hypothetical protein [Flavobacteriales bacterium]